LYLAARDMNVRNLVDPLLGIQNVSPLQDEGGSCGIHEDIPLQFTTIKLQ